MSDNQQKTEELPAAVIAALTKGRKIEAVKILRREWNTGLKESKEHVEHYLSSTNRSQGARRTPTVDAGIGRVLSFIILVIVVAIGYYMWARA